MGCRRGPSCLPAAAAAGFIYVLVERGVPGVVAVDGALRGVVAERGSAGGGGWVLGDVGSSVCRQVLRERVCGRAGIVGFLRGEAVGWLGA